MKRRIAISDRLAKSLVALFFAALIVLGLLTVSDYGPTWDEGGELNILRMALMEYGELLPFETSFHQQLVQRNTLRLSESIERDHGSCLYYPLVFWVCNPDISGAQVSAIWCSYIWLIFVLGLFALYAICRHMGLSRGMGCLAVLFLLLSPRFFADGHYNNKDIGLMVSVLLVLWQAVRLKERPTFGRGALFAFIAALCISMRIIGAAVCGLCALLIVADLLSRHAFKWRVVWVGLFALALSLGFYLLLSPAFLRNPGEYITYVVRNSYSFSRWNGSFLFMGNVVDLSASKPPFYYLPVTIVLTTPVWVLALIAVGQARVAREMLRQRLGFLHDKSGFLVALCTLTWLGALLGCMVMRVRVYNGWRHIYFIYGPMMVIAAYGFAGLWARAKSAANPLWRYAFAVLAALVLVVSAVRLAINHPYQYAYYSPLVSRATLAQRYDLDYWNVSVKNALEQLLEKTDVNEKLSVMPCDIKTRSGLVRAINRLEAGGSVEMLPVGSTATGTYYVIANTAYAELVNWQPTEDMRPVVTISSYGANICTVYQAGK